MHSMLLVFLALLPAAASAPPAKECPEFPAKLQDCVPYQCEFTHPFTGEKMKRTIVGMKDGMCSYVEQMPNGGRMECAYDEDLRKRAATFYREMDAATDAHATIESRSHFEGSKARSTTLINGKEIKNPLQDAFDNGVCNILGYHLPQAPSHGPGATSSSSAPAHASAAGKASTGSLTAADRDRNAQIVRTMKARQEFMKTTGHPYGWKDHVIGYVVPLCKGGTETPSNMQWLTADEAKAKAKTDCGQSQ